MIQERGAVVAHACRLIERAEKPPVLEALASAVGLSPSHFHRVFKGATGVTPRAYAAAVRDRRVREALGGGSTVTDAMYAAGFGSSGRFYATANASLGMRPGRFRAGGVGERIRYAVGRSSLGQILVAATDKGVCAIFIGDRPRALVRGLRARFPQAELGAGDATFSRTVRSVVEFVESPRENLDLPLDVRGTVFQQRVWQALRRIPPGKTASYAEIAARIGAPKAARAVARACATNDICLAIPCHRVIHADGSVSGYRWGVERKRTLLEREQAAARPGLQRARSR